VEPTDLVVGAALAWAKPPVFVSLIGPSESGDETIDWDALDAECSGDKTTPNGRAPTFIASDDDDAMLAMMETFEAVIGPSRSVVLRTRRARMTPTRPPKRWRARASPTKLCRI
jgi:hypothetical protein